MDRFGRDLSSPMGGHDPPQLLLHRLQASRSRSSNPRSSRLLRFDPPTRSTLPSTPVHSIQPVDPVREITPPEENTPHAGEEEQEQRVVEGNVPYDQVYVFLE